MSMGHNPENEDDFEGSGRCPVCRTYSDELLFHCCSCCPDAVASCVNDECHGLITRTRGMDYSPVEGRLADARRSAGQRNSRQRDAIRAR